LTSCSSTQLCSSALRTVSSSTCSTMFIGRKFTLLLAAAALLLVVQAPAAQARIDRASIACSMYVDPCHCGLCPRIVDCSKQPTAECFCGTAAPGIYPHPSDASKFWMCSYDTLSHIPYGVEVPCPARLVFDPVVKVCTVPAAMSPAPTKDTPTTATPPPANKPTTTPTTTTEKATGSQTSASAAVTDGIKSVGGVQGSTQGPPRSVGTIQESGPKKGAAYRLSVAGSLRVSGGRKDP
jgi:hypothetical protein